MRIQIAAQIGQFRSSLEKVLADTVPQFELEEVAGHFELLRSLKQTRFDLIIVLLPLSGAGSEAVILSVRNAAPSSLLLLASADEDQRLVASAFAAGAVGYVDSNIEARSMGIILHQVLSGGIYLPPGFTQPEEIDCEDMSARNDFPRLSVRELEVAHLMEAGHSNQMIGEALSIATATVKRHIYIIMRVLNVKNRTEAAYKLRTFGLLPIKFQNVSTLAHTIKTEVSAKAEQEISYALQTALM